MHAIFRKGGEVEWNNEVTPQTRPSGHCFFQLNFTEFFDGVS
jgi:hypothetical protein